MLAISVATGCGAATSLRVSPAATPRSTPSPTATAPAASATPVPLMDVIVVSDSQTVQFLRPDGTEMGHAAIPAAFDYSAADGRIWLIDSVNGHLIAASPDGSSVDYGALEGGLSAGFGLAVRPDGRSWAWGVCAACDAATSATADAQVYVGGIGLPTKLVYQEHVSACCSGTVLVPLGWTAKGLIVDSDRNDVGGCCYFTPESLGINTLLIDPATSKVLATWTGCGTTFVSPSGSFACAGPAITVHSSDGSIRTILPLGPVAALGWVHVDDAHQRVVFTVVHSRGHGDGSCPCVIDVESGNLNTGTVTKLADQVTLDGLLSDGRLIVRSAPIVPGSTPWSEWLVSSDGTRTPIGPSDGVEVVAVLPS